MNLVSIGSRQVQGRTVATRLPPLSGLPPSSHPPRGPTFNSLGTNRPPRTLSRGMDRSRAARTAVCIHPSPMATSLPTTLI